VYAACENAPAGGESEKQAVGESSAAAGAATSENAQNRPAVVTDGLGCVANDTGEVHADVAQKDTRLGAWEPMAVLRVHTYENTMPA
jgi:hypothetical protein